MDAQDTLDLRQLLMVLRRRLWLLVAVPLVAALAAGLVSLYVITPVYEASVTLWVVKKEGGPLDYSALLLNRNLTKTYAEVAKSRTVAAATLRKLGLAEDVDRFLKRVTVTTVRDTEILRIAVEDTDPARAALTANTLAQEFMAELPKFITLDNVRVVDPAQPPTQPDRPKPLLNTALALVLGLMAATGAAFLLEALDVTLRTPEDVERHLALPVLGGIPVIEPAQVQQEAGARTRRRRSPAPVPARIEGGERE